MSNKRLDKFKQILLEKKDFLLSSNAPKYHESNLILNSDDLLDDTDVATQASMREIDCQLLDREYKELQNIEAALKRIESGEYGTCLDCGEDISEKRLEVQPFAVYCITHAEQQERMNRKIAAG